MSLMDKFNPVKVAGEMKKVVEEHKEKEFKRVHGDLIAAEGLTHITISTSGISEKFKVLDVVYANVSVTQKLFDLNFDGSISFDKVKATLKIKCNELGGDAVINCDFGQVYGGTVPQQTATFWGYGTAVKILAN